MARVIGTAVVEVKADVDGFRRGLAGIGSSLTSSFAAIGGAVAAVGIANLGKEAIDFGAQTTIALDKAMAMFRGLTDSEREADEMLRRLTQYAIDTPFELPGLSAMAAQLIAVGDGFGVTTDNVLSYLDTIGNVTAASGGNEETMTRIVRVLGQMSSTGKVLGQDMNQLAQNIPGMDVWGVLAEGTGKSVEELRALQDAGKLDELLTGNEAVQILLEGMKEFPGAAGAMERQMDTLGGSISKFKEQLGLALSTGLQPFFDTLRAVMGDPAIMASLTGMIASFSALASSILAGLAPALPVLMDLVTTLMDGLMPLAPIVGQLAGVLLGLLTPLLPPIMAIVEALAGPLTTALDVLGPLFANLATVIGGALLDVIDALAPILPKIVQAFLTLVRMALPPLVGLFEAIAPLLTQAADILVATLAPILPVIAQAFGQLVYALAPIVRELLPVFQVILDAMAPALPMIAESMAQLALAVVDLLVALVPLIPPFTELISFIATIAVSQIAMISNGFRIFADVLTFVLGKVTWFVDEVIGFFQRMYDVLVGNSIIPDLVEAVIRWFTLLWNAIMVIVNAISTFVVGVWNGIKSTVETIVNGIARIVSTVWDGIRIAVETAINTARDTVDTVVNGIETTIDTVFNAVKTTVTTIWNGIRDAIKNPIEAAYNFVKDKVDAIKGLLDGIGDVVSNIPGAGLVKRGIGFIPGLAAGGIVRSPTLAMIGEGRGPEVVIPMTNPGRAMQLMQQSGLDRLAANMNRGGWGGPLISMPGAVIQDATDADLVAQRTLVAMRGLMVA